tara:strand:- start:464 stop:682 length:219 start_codon:yes stop_codon:yes gene_type:complete
MLEIFKGFILFLFVDGTPLEFTPKESLSDCLKTKREIARNVGNSNRYSCGQGQIRMEEHNGKMQPIELLERG